MPATSQSVSSSVTGAAYTVSAKFGMSIGGHGTGAVPLGAPVKVSFSNAASGEAE